MSLDIFVVFIILCANTLGIELIEFHTHIYDYFADCNHLKCFVDVGKSIAKNSSEGTHLSNLYDIGVKFDTLIYHLPENTGFDEFHSKCKSVLGTLKEYSYLTNIMVSFIM